MGCFSAEKPEQKFKIAPWLKAPTQAISKGVQSAMKQPFEAYTGPRVAQLSSEQQNAMDMFNAMLGENGQGMGIPRLIDDIPGIGPLKGTMQDYMDPYLSAVLGPALRELGIAQAGNLQDLDAQRNMAGAFGDTGAAFAKSLSNKDYLEAISDTTGKISSQGFNTAMGMRSEDINRLMANRQAQEGALKDLFNMGGVSQATSQRELDAQWEEFLRRTGFTWDQLAKAGAITGGLSGGNMVTTPGSPSTMSKVLSGAGAAAAMLI